MTKKIYTGIGSRDTPEKWLEIFSDIGFLLASKDWTLRSGGADGADIAFENGCDAADGSKEIFLPWAGFNHSKSKLYHVPRWAFVTVAAIHENWTDCSQAAHNLLARDALQIHGQYNDVPTHIVLCWTKNGKLVGGTRIAIKLALAAEIPIINFGEPIWDLSPQNVKLQFKKYMIKLVGGF